MLAAAVAAPAILAAGLATLLLQRWTPRKRRQRMDDPLSPAKTSRAGAPATEAAGSPWLSTALRPILGFRLAYLPLVMIYFAYGALGLIDVSRDMWIKERLTWSPAELAGIGV